MIHDAFYRKIYRLMSDITRILNRIADGDSSATDDLLPLVYDELRRLATKKVRNEQPGQALDATALVHEAYLRLAGDTDTRWSSRAHFFGAAAEAMRRILIEQARARKRAKRGGEVRILSLDSVGPITADRAEELIHLNEALDNLEDSDPEKAQLVKLKFFVGLTTEGAADVLGLPVRTAERSWAFARAWLYRQMADSGNPE